jgi:hypothetical protein
MRAVLNASLLVVKGALGVLLFSAARIDLEFFKISS